MPKKNRKKPANRQSAARGPGGSGRSSAAQPPSGATRAKAASPQRQTGSRKPQATTAPAPPVGLIIGVVLTGLVVVLVLVFFVFRDSDDDPLVATGSQNSLAEGGGVVVADGAEVPAVTLYVDYSCPGCAWFEPVGGAALFDAAEQEQIDLTVVTMSFLGPAPDGNSALAANAAQCADDQGVFREYHDLLFAWTPEQIEDRSAPERGTDELIALAPEAGVPEAGQQDFAACVNDGAYLEYVQDMQTQSERDDVGGTPRVYLDGAELGEDQIEQLATDEGALQTILGQN